MELFVTNHLRYVIASIPLLLSMNAYAGAKFVINTGYDFGGDRLVSTTYTNGTTGKIDANQGLYLGIGGAYRFGYDDGLEIMATYNYKFQLNTASNGDASFDVTSLEAVLLYNFDKFNIGVGATHQYSPKVSGSGVASGLNVTYDDASGSLVQAGWRFAPNVSAGLRYTKIQYKGLGLYNKSGNSLGLYLTTEF